MALSSNFNESAEALRQAIEGLHNCRATYREIARVTEIFEGQVVWDGDVFIFDLEGHPKARIAYAWSSPIEGSKKHRFYAVLHAGPVKSARDAVKATIVKDYQESEGK